MQNNKVTPLAFVIVNGEEIIIEYNTLVRTGSYNPNKNTIYLNRELLNRPKLHQSVLDHEIEHVENKDKILASSFVDLRDGWEHDFNPEYIQYKLDTKPKNNYVLKVNLTTIFLNIFFTPFIIYHSFKSIKYNLSKSIKTLLIVDGIIKFSVMFIMFTLLALQIFDVIEKHVALICMCSILIHVIISTIIRDKTFKEYFKRNPLWK